MNGEVRVYQEKSLVSIVKIPCQSAVRIAQIQAHTTIAPVSALKFGRFGREDGALGSD